MRIGRSFVWALLLAAAVGCRAAEPAEPEKKPETEEKAPEKKPEKKKEPAKKKKPEPEAPAAADVLWEQMKNKKRL